MLHNIIAQTLAGFQYTNLNLWQRNNLNCLVLFDVCLEKTVLFHSFDQRIIYMPSCPQGMYSITAICLHLYTYKYSRTTDTRKLNLKFFAVQIQIPLPNKQAQFFVEIMENMDKELTVPKWVLPKIPQMPQKMSAQNVCPSPKSSRFLKKMLSLGVRSLGKYS